MPRHALISSGSAEHYGPPMLLGLVHRVMGGIDLDPASCASANRIVRATTFLTEADDGLAKQHEWAGRVYLNPPGGKGLHAEDVEIPVPKGRRTHNRQALWWAALCDAYEQGRVTQAIFTCFSLDLLERAQDYPCAHPLDFPYCLPRDRLAFWTDDDGVLRPEPSPTHSNMIVYLPPRSERDVREEHFVRVFSALGRTVRER